MRKLFLSMAAVAALLASCSKDETTTAPVIERSKVTFTVNAPELSTRAEDNYGTGHTAKTLDYVIYDLAEEAGKNQITGTTTFPDGELETTVTVDLVEGREYEAIFFAHAEGAPYTFNKTEQTMTINTTSLKANAESYDAFYKYVEPFVMPATGLTKDVEMTRPFAQLNVATNDFDTQAGKLIDAATTGIEVEAYNTLNFKDGTVDGKETIIYALADKMDGTISANNENYSWLTMNYILVNTKENVGVTFLFTDEDKDGNKQTYTREYSAVPVQRNHKTNIIGSILTSETKFNVEILPGFEDPEHDYNVDTTEETVVTTVEDLQAAINAATAGTNIIKFGKKITAGTTRATAKGIVISQKDGVNIVIDGDGNEFDGTFFINGGSKTSATETLTFTNIKFTHTSGDIDFINGNDASSTNRYSHNITVENCTFTGNANGNVVGMRFRQGYGNFNVVNCTVNENMFLLMWATNMNGLITFDGVTANNNLKEGAISLNGNFKAVIKNSNIATTGYGVRLADKDTTNIDVTFENNSISADVPVAVRNLNDTDKANVSFGANNKLETLNNNVYDVVFTTSGTYNDLVAPATENGPVITLTGADSYNVFPRDLVIATAEELKAFRDAVNAGNSYKDKVVKLAADINLGGIEWKPIGGDDGYANNFAGTFDGKGYTVSNFTVNNSKNAGFFGTLGGAVIKNLIIDNATLTTNHYAGGIVAWVESGATNSSTKPLIENCHVKNTTITLSTEQVNGKWDNGDKAGGIVGFAHNASIVGCSVEKTTIKAYREAAGIVGYSNGATVRDNKVLQDVMLIQDNTHNYKNYTSEADVLFGDIVGRRGTNDILEGGNSGTVTKQGGIFDGYYIDANGIGYVWKAKGLNLCLAAGATTINLSAEADGKEYNIDNGTEKTLTFIGTEKNPADVVIKVVGTGAGEAGGQLDYGLDSSTVTFNNLTIKTNNQTYAGYARLTATFNNCIMDQCFCLNGKSEFTDCVFNVSGNQYNIWTWGGKEAKFTKCTFNCDGKAILVYNQSADVTFDTCIFNDNGSISGKAAIETGVDGVGPKYNIYINNTKFTGFDENKGYQNIVGNKNSMTNEYLNVVIDGVDVY